MRIKRLFIAAVASVLFGAEAIAAQRWVATGNEQLYQAMLTCLRNFQGELFGEPVYYQAQNLEMAITAAHKADEYAWMSQVHNFCNYLEDIYPPVIGHPRESLDDKYETIRRNLVLLRDFPMHQVWQTNDSPSPTQIQIDAFNAANKQWLHYKRAQFFEFLRGPRPAGNEIQVVKLYSSGVVFRTKSACIGMDITYESRLYDDEGIEELADILDVIYVTHAHTDHFDQKLLQAMLRKGKCVVGPHTMEKYISGSDWAGKKYLWSDTQEEAVLVGGVASTQAFMSEQKPEPCLLYLVDLGGWRMIHVGDNSEHVNEQNYLRYPMADFVMSPVFQGLVTLFKSTYGGLNPDGIEQYYINIHENEYLHTVDGRIAFDYMYKDANSLGNTVNRYPNCLILDCGEHIVMSK